ncbi:hypothetical protein CRP01_39855 [Flavilitoribacter nigricans DSM 23189 = NBRC 102662]|uniref:Uncharacterized protein n=1 Tax=Flavilitoribacter nigricans (strain ATCC 23147 / DSM 23189 / NBRC 102662 / NCIMB 1420 / SS-2) TaxID=1122177 RepID=A0A2D0MXG5_FLAN2|nr:hypothetical protein CRP01_39855 [Flavilitoribacter nigricans DSM 23189 = NBRC 102662]
MISPSKVRLRPQKGIKIIDYILKSKLQEGRNYLRFGDRRMFVGVKAGKVLSAKVMDPMGQWGPNVITTGQKVMKFTCTGGICYCQGDNNCNNMFTSTVCRDAAVCIDDKCYYARN